MPPKNVLLATDLDVRTDRAMDRAAALALEWRTQLVIVHAIETSPEESSRTRTNDPRAAAIQRIRADLREPQALDLELVVEHGDSARLTLDAVARHGCELVVTGVSRDVALGRVSAGATVDALARRSPVPLLAVKRRPNRPYRNVVVATDFSEGSRVALLTVLEMFPATLVILFHAYHVMYEGFMDNKAAARDAARRHAEERASSFLAETAVGEDRQILARCEYGEPAHVLRELALTGAVDLVVAGTRGRGPVAEFFLGSVAKSILAQMPCDVMVVGERGNRVAGPAT